MLPRNRQEAQGCRYPLRAPPQGRQATVESTRRSPHSLQERRIGRGHWQLRSRHHPALEVLQLSQRTHGLQELPPLLLVTQGLMHRRR